MARKTAFIRTITLAKKRAVMKQAAKLVKGGMSRSRAMKQAWRT